MKVKLSEIKVGNRIRTDLADLEVLAKSISQHGLIQPIVINSNYELVAGGRRLAACKLLGLEEVEAVFKDTLSPEHLLELELEENLARRDLSDMEKLQALKRLHELKCRKDPTWTLEKTAERLSLSVGWVSIALKVVDGFQVSPEQVETALEKGGIKAAYKEAKKAIISQIHTVIVEQNRPKLAKAEELLKLGDALELIKSVPSESIDFIHTDPPYGVDLRQVREAKPNTYTELIYSEDSLDNFKRLVGSLAPELWRVARPDSFALIWCAFRTFPILSEAMQAAGWAYRNPPFIWVKWGEGYSPAPLKAFASKVDSAFLFTKGNPTMNRSLSNAFVSGAPKDGGWHPLERPQDLLDYLHQAFIKPGFKVLDTFAGSGSTLISALKFDAIPLGFELDKVYYDRALLDLSAFLLSKKETFNETGTK
ncbi:MAG: ParB/RepB/Spo0J family partition protein [Candidatus Caldarchaeum sp.]